jgi:hypothetical protein
VPDGRLARKAYSTESAVIVKALAEVTIADSGRCDGVIRGLSRCGAFYRNWRHCQARKPPEDLEFSSKSVTCATSPPLATRSVAGSGCVLYDPQRLNARGGCENSWRSIDGNAMSPLSALSTPRTWQRIKGGVDNSALYRGRRWVLKKRTQRILRMSASSGPDTT